MTAIARVTLLDLRTIKPYRNQAFIIGVLVMAIMANQPTVIVPGLILLAASVTAGYPFQVSDKADLDTLYAVLPLSRRSLVFGHYLAALLTFVVYAALGTIEAVISAHVQHTAFGWSKIGEILAVSWMLFALNTMIKFPLFVRLGYSQIGMLGTTLPIAVVAIVVTKAHFSMPSTTTLYIVGACSVILFGLSAVVAVAVDPRRIHNSVALAQ